MTSTPRRSAGGLWPAVLLVTAAFSSGCLIHSPPISHAALAPGPDPSAGRVTASPAVILHGLEDPSSLALQLFPAEAGISFWPTEALGLALCGNGQRLRLRARWTPISQLPNVALIPGVSGGLHGWVVLSTTPIPRTENGGGDVAPPTSLETWRVASGGASLGLQVGIPLASTSDRPSLFITVEDHWESLASFTDNGWDRRDVENYRATTLGVAWMVPRGRLLLVPELVVGRTKMDDDDPGFFASFALGLSAPFGRSD